MSKEQKNQNSSVREKETLSTSLSAPLIFISHDSRDSQAAEFFSKLLAAVSAGVLKSFRSSDKKGTQGIEYGVEWFPTLMSRLEEASDVVCLLTENSLDRPWILYEAGVAKGKLDTPVHGVALGVPFSRANTGPFAQFQNSDDDEDSITKLVLQLLQRVPGSEPDQDAILVHVRDFKKKLKAVISTTGPPKTKGRKPRPGEASVLKLFEEIKVMFRDLRKSDIRERNLLQSGPEGVDFLIHNVKTNECLRTSGPRRKNGSSLKLATCKGDEDQRWYLQRVDRGYFAVISVHTELCIDVDGHSKKPGSKVHQWDFHGGDNQKWALDHDKDGTYKIRSKNSSLYLAPHEGHLAQVLGNDSRSQRWRLEPVFR